MPVEFLPFTAKDGIPFEFAWAHGNVGIPGTETEGSAKTILERGNSGEGTCVTRCLEGGSDV